jgi:hypothetical protein
MELARGVPRMTRVHPRERFPIPGPGATCDESIKEAEQNLAAEGCPGAINEETKDG